MKILLEIIAILARIEAKLSHLPKNQFGEHLTVREAALYAKVTTQTIHNWKSSGKLKFHSPTGSKQIYILKKDLEDVMFNSNNSQE